MSVKAKSNELGSAKVIEHLKTQCDLDAPRFHGEGTYAIDWGVVDQFASYVGQSSKTIETGAGVSTLAFTTLGCDHTAIIPVQSEADLIIGWLVRNSISTEHLHFDVRCSWDALPEYGTDSYDLALIDGCHGFPAPYIDFFYFSRILRIGGFLLLDDIQIWTCKVLMEFLKSEPAWKLVSMHGKTAIFEKLKDVSGEQWEFIHQPYVMSRSGPSVFDRLRGYADLGRRAGKHIARGDVSKIRKGIRSVFFKT